MVRSWGGLPQVAPCGVCGDDVHRTYAAVALVRDAALRFAAATVAVGYCREHRGDARAQLFVRMRGFGEVVAHTRLVVVRPGRHEAWQAKALRLAREQWHESLGEQVATAGAHPAHAAYPSYPAYPHEPTEGVPRQKAGAADRAAVRRPGES